MWACLAAIYAVIKEPGLTLFALNFNATGREELVPKLPPQQAARVPQLPPRRHARRRELVCRPGRGDGRRRCLDRGGLGEPSVRRVGEHVNQHQGLLVVWFGGKRLRAGTTCTDHKGADLRMLVFREATWINMPSTLRTTSSSNAAAWECTLVPLPAQKHLSASYTKQPIGGHHMCTKPHSPLAKQLRWRATRVRRLQQCYARRFRNVFVFVPAVCCAHDTTRASLTTPRHNK